VNKRHAPLWQAWGVMETRAGNGAEARNVFQQGIWACAQLGGGQSGGYKCARLWQAWGVLEAQEGDYPAARRCFNRALDADKRNIASIIAWTRMEEDIENLKDCSLIFERALKEFRAGTDEKGQIWRAYELMEQRTGNDMGAQDVYQRSMRESMSFVEESMMESMIESDPIAPLIAEVSTAEDSKSKRNAEQIEFSRWNDVATSMKGEVWFKNGSIEGKVPKATMNKKRQQKK
jgi:tetratricopeptide (TPR) repeat protein